MPPRQEEEHSVSSLYESPDEETPDSQVEVPLRRSKRTRQSPIYQSICMIYAST